MNFKKKTWVRTLFLAGVALLAGSAVAAAHEAVLGNDGELYVVRTGAYSALFPGKSETDANNSVLALEITRPGEAPQRTLVPGTKDRDIESSPGILFEADSGTLFLVWESRSSSLSVLRLSNFDGTTWSPAIEVTGNSYSAKASPQLATTRDSYRDLDADGQPVLKHRNVLHLTWSEETAPAFYEAFYTPVILDEGTFIGRNPILRLNSFDKSEDEPGMPVSAELVRSPRPQAGHDGRTIMISFASAVTGRLVSLEVDVLPVQIRQLADKARAYIIDLGAQQKPDLPTLAARTRSFILASAEDFQPEVAQSMADLLHAYILTQSGATILTENFTLIADKARAYIIDLGAKFSGRVLKPVAGESKSSAQILQIVPQLSTMPVNPPVHLLQVRTASSRPAPAIGNGPVQIFVSETGASSLISWLGTNRIYYRETVVGNGWSEIREIKLNDNFNLDKAYEVLNQRVQNR